MPVGAFMSVYREEARIVDASDGFASFVEEAGGRLRLALIARYGPDKGAEVTADALAYAWEHWDRIRAMHNPAGYLFRVGQSRARRGVFRPAPRLERPVNTYRAPWVEPGLEAAIESLSPRQRTSIVLVHGFGWTITEVAEVLGIGFSSVKRHLERGMTRLRDDLGVEHA